MKIIAKLNEKERGECGVEYAHLTEEKRGGRTECTCRGQS